MIDFEQLEERAFLEQLLGLTPVLFEQVEIMEEQVNYSATMRPVTGRTLVGLAPVEL